MIVLSLAIPHVANNNAELWYVTQQYSSAYFCYLNIFCLSVTLLVWPAPPLAPIFSVSTQAKTIWEVSPVSHVMRTLRILITHHQRYPKLNVTTSKLIAIWACLSVETCMCGKTYIYQIFQLWWVTYLCGLACDYKCSVSWPCSTMVRPCPLSTKTGKIFQSKVQGWQGENYFAPEDKWVRYLPYCMECYMNIFVPQPETEVFKYCWRCFVFHDAGWLVCLSRLSHSSLLEIMLVVIVLSKIWLLILIIMMMLCCQNVGIMTASNISEGVLRQWCKVRMPQPVLINMRGRGWGSV